MNIAKRTNGNAFSIVARVTGRARFFSHGSYDKGHGKILALSSIFKLDFSSP